MENLDKAERMLRQCPRGIRAEDFMRKMGFSSRQTAYNYLNSLELKGKAYNEHGLWFPKEVKAHDSSFGTSVEKAPQGHANKKDKFSPQKEAFLYRCFERLDYIASINNHGSSFEAYRDLRSLIWTLPSPIKDKLRPMIEKTDEALRNCKDEWVRKKRLVPQLPPALLNRTSEVVREKPKIRFIQEFVNRKPQRKAIAFHSVEKLVDEISSLLHEQLEKETL